MRILDILTEAKKKKKKATKTRLDPKCWKGKKIGNPKTKIKGGVRVNNCVPKESVSKSAPELLKAEIPLHRHAEELLARNGVSKDDPAYHKHLANTIKHLRQFGNIDLINKQGVSEGDIFFIEAGDTLIETTVVYESKGRIIVDLDEDAINLIEAKYHGRTVSLGKPMKGDVKKSKVYVRKPNGNIVKVNFGDKKMRIKKSNPKRRKSFRARHNCKNPGPRWKARYWSCRAW